MPHLMMLLFFLNFILRELSSYRACVVIWGNLWNSNTSWLIQTIFVLTINFFRFGLFMNTGWMSILAKTFWKRRLLMNLAFSILKISLISFLKGSRLPGKTRLSLPSSWKNKCIHNNNTHTVRCDENCVRTNKQCNQPYQH